MALKPTMLLEVQRPILREVFQKCAAQAGIDLHEPGTGSPDLLVIEANGNLDALKERLQALQDHGSGQKIVLVGNAYDTELLLVALHAGVDAFFPNTTDEEEVGQYVKALAVEYRQQAGAGPSLGKVLSLLSLKSDCGTTTLAVNLAHAAQVLHNEAKVALVDFDLPHGDSRIMLDLDCRFDWGEALGNMHRLDTSYLAGLMTGHKSGLKLLPPPTRLNELGVIDTESLTAIMGHLRNAFDIIVADLGAYLDEVSDCILRVSDEVLLVGLPTRGCVKRLGHHLEFLRKDEGWEKDKYKLVVNRYLPQAAKVVEEQEELLGAGASWLLPDDYKTTLMSINLGKPLLECAPKAQITRAIRGMVPPLFTRLGKGRKASLRPA